MKLTLKTTAVAATLLAASALHAKFDDDRNFIGFSPSVTNQYVNSGATIQLNVTAGQPCYVATLVDNTNFGGAVWNTYTSPTVTVNLGSNQGWHNVYIGLRDRPANAIPTWLSQHLFLASPPVLTITNPTTFTVDEPTIQIFGYCQESLASISYDLSNSSGFFPDQPSEITDQYFDRNAFGITTNYFECLDVPLIKGLNVITMHATDLAGNTTTTNLYFTFDYSRKTNPPILRVTWPQNGAQISGAIFTCVGRVSDPAAIVRASTRIIYGGAGTYSAEVGRDGNFSIENLPLNPGSNSFTITAQDAAGNTTITNILVLRTNFVLTINPQPAASQPRVAVSGTISDPTYAVWVNGVKGTNNGNGTWSAINVPANNGQFTVTAYAPDEKQPDGSYGR